jgi:L-alanine-DL-glutamate epimerase-like enolase superfamily enzyme
MVQGQTGKQEEMMIHDHRMTRKRFLAGCGALTAGAVFAQRLLAAEGVGGDTPEPLCLKSWEPVEFPERRKFRDFIKITASDGSVGYSRALGRTRDLKLAEQAVARANLLDHEALYDLMVSKQVPELQRKVLDIACWDLHARMTNKPLHALLGTRKKRILRYGDVRWHASDMTPEKYAKQVASYLDRTGMTAVKLHFPGNMGNEDSLPFDDIIDTLTAMREAVGDDKILAWDPYPRKAESATTSLDEAKEMIRHMDDLGYSWLEGPLLPVPYDEQIPKYVELMQMKPELRIQAEGHGSPIGDGTVYSDMVRWVEAGAVNQCSTDAYIRGGVTHAKRFLDYAKTRENLVINLHWAWAPHAHLVMAYDDSICPVAEFPMTEDIPQTYLEGPYLLAPDWPGIYHID